MEKHERQFLFDDPTKQIYELNLGDAVCIRALTHNERRDLAFDAIEAGNPNLAMVVIGTLMELAVGTEVPEDLRDTTDENGEPFESALHYATACMRVVEEIQQQLIE